MAVTVADVSGNVLTSAVYLAGRDWSPGVWLGILNSLKPSDGVGNLPAIVQAP